MKLFSLGSAAELIFSWDKMTIKDIHASGMLSLLSLLTMRVNSYKCELLCRGENLFNNKLNFVSKRTVALVSYWRYWSRACSSIVTLDYHDETQWGLSGSTSKECGVVIRAFL